MNTPPPIPPIHDEELRMAVSSLCYSAQAVHSALTAVLAGKDMGYIVENHKVLFLAEKVIHHWGEFFEKDQQVKMN